MIGLRSAKPDNWRRFAPARAASIGERESSKAPSPERRQLFCNI